MDMYLHRLQEHRSRYPMDKTLEFIDKKCVSIQYSVTRGRKCNDFLFEIIKHFVYALVEKDNIFSFRRVFFSLVVTVGSTVLS
jgi:hypothetical protein